MPARLLESGGLTRLGLQLGVELDSVFGQLREDSAVAQLRQEPGRMPRSAPGKLLALEEHDVRPAQLGEMVRDAAPDDAATDNDDSCPIG